MPVKKFENKSYNEKLLNSTSEKSNQEKILFQKIWTTKYITFSNFTRKKLLGNSIKKLTRKLYTKKKIYSKNSLRKNQQNPIEKKTII